MKLSDVSGIAAATFASKLLTENIDTIRMITRTYELGKMGAKQAAKQIDDELLLFMLKQAQKEMELEHQGKQIVPRGTTRKRKK